MDEIVKSDVGNNEVATALDNIDSGGSKMGRPLKFETPEKLEEKCNEYFKSCWADVPVIAQFGPVMVDDEESEPIAKKNKKTGEIEYKQPQKPLTEYKQVIPYTITGLADYLQTDRQTLINYSNRQDFSDTIKNAKVKIERYTEEMLFLSKNATGPIFNLKNNYGWTDKQETILSGPNGGPLQVQPVPFSYQDFASLSPDDRQKIEDAARIMESLKNR